MGKIPPHFHDFKVKRSKRKIGFHSFQMKITVFAHAVHTSNHRGRRVQIHKLLWTVTVNIWGFGFLLTGTSVLKKHPSTSPASSPLFNSNPPSSNPVPYRMSSLLPIHAYFFFPPQVANLACSISNNEEGVKLVRMAATQIDSLCPQVSINP